MICMIQSVHTAEVLRGAGGGEEGDTIFGKTRVCKTIF